MALSGVGSRSRRFSAELSSSSCFIPLPLVPASARFGANPFFRQPSLRYPGTPSLWKCARDFGVRTDQLQGQVQPVSKGKQRSCRRGPRARLLGGVGRALPNLPRHGKPFCMRPPVFPRCLRQQSGKGRPDADGRDATAQGKPVQQGTGFPDPDPTALWRKMAGRFWRTRGSPDVRLPRGSPRHGHRWRH